MPTDRVLHFGGNGHARVRIASVQAVLAKRGGPSLVDIPYPGFEGRPRAASLDKFLAAVAQDIATAQGEAAPSLLYGTGIGALFALCLRAQGKFLECPILLQGPVLWGLEHRLMPRLMRFRPAQSLLRTVFALPAFQAQFARKYFTRPLSPREQAAFFTGYARCAALPDFFRWLTPSLLRELEAQFRENPKRLSDIKIWQGGRDRVVSLQEVRWTEAALGVRFPTRVFPEWGHYPMMDDPDGWVQALTEEAHG